MMFLTLFRSAYFDIAIIEVTKKIPFKKNIFPICIPEVPINLKNVGADVSGYGPSDEKPVLSVASLNVRSTNYCTQKYNSIEPEEEGYREVQQVGT